MTPPKLTPERAPGDRLSDDLGWGLAVVFRAYVKAADAVTDGIPGGHRGYQVLCAAARDEPGSQAAMAGRLGIDRTVMTYLLDDLEAADLVARRPDPADRRSRRVVATDHGRVVLADREPGSRPPSSICWPRSPRGPGDLPRPAAHPGHPRQRPRPGRDGLRRHHRPHCPRLRLTLLAVISIIVIEC